MIRDKNGNILYREYDNIYLKLANENRIRNIGEINEKERTLLVIRNKKKHFHRAMNGYGFNYSLLYTATKIDYVLLKVGTKDLFKIPLRAIFTYGEYLHFKKEGYELQIFMQFPRLEEYRIK